MVGRYNRYHERFYRWYRVVPSQGFPFGAWAVPPHNPTVTHVQYYRLLPCGTTAAFQAPEVPPPSTGLYQTSGTTAPLSGSTGACVRAYIYSTGLKGCLFPFVLVPLFLALAAGHLYPCLGVRLALRILGSPWILSMEASRSLPMDGGNASCSFPLDFFRVLPCLGLYLSFRV